MLIERVHKCFSLHPCPVDKDFITLCVFLVNSFSHWTLTFWGMWFSSSSKLFVKEIIQLKCLPTLRIQIILLKFKCFRIIFRKKVKVRFIEIKKFLVIMHEYIAGGFYRQLQVTCGIRVEYSVNQQVAILVWWTGRRWTDRKQYLQSKKWLFYLCTSTPCNDNVWGSL